MTGRSREKRARARCSGGRRSGLFVIAHRGRWPGTRAAVASPSARTLAGPARADGIGRTAHLCKSRRASTGAAYALSGPDGERPVSQSDPSSPLQRRAAAAPRRRVCRRGRRAPARPLARARARTRRSTGRSRSCSRRIAFAAGGSSACSSCDERAAVRRPRVARLRGARSSRSRPAAAAARALARPGRASSAGSGARARPRSASRCATASSRRSRTSRTRSRGPDSPRRRRAAARAPGRELLGVGFAGVVAVDERGGGATGVYAELNGEPAAWWAEVPRRPAQRAVGHRERRLRCGARDGLRRRQLAARQPAAGGRGSARRAGRGCR